METIKFSVVIVSFKNVKVITDCLDSLIKYNDIGNGLEIIVVDNSPDMLLFKHLVSRYKTITVIKNENKGFGEANNVGAKSAKGQFLLFLNPDTILVEPIFKFAIEKFNSNQNLGLFGVKLVDTNQKDNMSFYFIDKTGFIYSQFIKTCNKLNFFIDGKMFISGADLFIRKKTFMKCGMFDENIFMYSEEADLTRRIKKQGWKTEYFKDKSIIHLEGKSSETKEDAIKRRLVSKKYYSKKYNLNFKKMVKKEINYEYLKFLFYKFTNNKKSKTQKKIVIILKKFLIKETEV